MSVFVFLVVCLCDHLFDCSFLCVLDGVFVFSCVCVFVFACLCGGWRLHLIVGLLVCVCVCACLCVQFRAGPSVISFAGVT